MQIHELNNRKKQDKEQVQEAPVLWNLGKEIIKNPKAAIMPHAFNTALGTAKQATNQQTAASLSAGLSKQGYTTAAGPKKAQDILPQVKSNPATQQMIKTLADQWQQFAAQLTGQPVKEGIVNELITPGNTSDVRYSAPTGAYAQMPAGYSKITQQGVAQPQQQSQQQSQQPQIKMIDQFTNWANSKLSSLNVDVDSINDDPAVASTLKNLANKIATNPNLTNDVIEYFNLAIAANIANNQTRRSGVYQPSAAAAQTSPQQITQQAGLTPQILQVLGAVLRKSDKGQMTMPRTGNPVADAMFQQMGFKLK